MGLLHVHNNYTVYLQQRMQALFYIHVFVAWVRRKYKSASLTTYNVQCTCTRMIALYSVCVLVHDMNSLQQLMRLYAKYREAEVHRKALVFQKQYLKCQVDAFFQTQQAALLMMADMGAPSASTLRSKSRKHTLLKFKTTVHAVMAAHRFQYVVRRKEQYIQSYSNRIEREKTDLHLHHHSTNGISISVRPTNDKAGAVLKHPPNDSAATCTSSIPHTASVQTSSNSRPKLSSMQPICSTHSQGTLQPTTTTVPQLSAYIPSLARLQARLGGTVN